MYSFKQRTCQYCEHWQNAYCPYYLEAVSIRPRTVEDLACGQFVSLRDVSKFKERKALTEEVVVKRQKTEKDKKRLNRAIEL